MQPGAQIGTFGHWKLWPYQVIFVELEIYFLSKMNRTVNQIYTQFLKNEEMDALWIHEQLFVNWVHCKIVEAAFSMKKKLTLQGKICSLKILQVLCSTDVPSWSHPQVSISLVEKMRNIIFQLLKLRCMIFTGIGNITAWTGTSCSEHTCNYLMLIKCKIRLS